MPSPAVYPPWIFWIPCLLTLTCLARASLWNSANWALDGNLAGSVGYDSNLTLSREGPEDAFVTINPSLSLFRRDSSTDLRIDGGATHTNFVHDRQPEQTDLNFSLACSYPKADNAVPLYQVDVTWLKTSQPNGFLGERVPSRQWNGDAEGYLPLSGKIGLRGSASYNSYNYEANDLNHSQVVGAATGLAYQRSPQTEASLNFGISAGHSQPNDPANVLNDVHSREADVTVKLRGDLAAKITGSVYIGFGRVNYTGGYHNRVNLPLGGASLTWTLDPRRSLALTAANGDTYTPDGETAHSVESALSFTHEIIDRWQYTLSVGAKHSAYSRVVHERTDDSWGLRAEFAYQPSKRFEVALSFAHTTQTSTDPKAEFGHDVITLGSSCHF